MVLLVAEGRGALASRRATAAARLPCPLIRAGMPEWMHRPGCAASRRPERPGIDPHDPVGEAAEIDVGAVGEQDQGETVVRVPGDERLEAEPASRMLQTPVPAV